MYVFSTEALCFGDTAFSLDYIIIIHLSREIKTLEQNNKLSYSHHSPSRFEYYFPIPFSPALTNCFKEAGA